MITMDGVVYSTEYGRMCPKCQQSIAGCLCKQQTSVVVTDNVVRISRETKGRKGKGVTVIKGLALDPLALTQLGKQLKTMCGSGGTVKNGVIEVQGDHVVLVSTHLKQQGWNIRAG
ncbi:MAG: stress response translation initiation inhibitor YciH [Magnetococcales bacterium]|nr:stress response translation initiation inhibitor YciH [Magnetococcales bacterium]